MQPTSMTQNQTQSQFRVFPGLLTVFQAIFNDNCQDLKPARGGAVVRFHRGSTIA
jgi:hypothetical protein